MYFFDASGQFEWNFVFFSGGELSGDWIPCLFFPCCCKCYTLIPASASIFSEISDQRKLTLELMTGSSLLGKVQYDVRLSGSYLSSELWCKYDAFVWYSGFRFKGAGHSAQCRRGLHIENPIGGIFLLFVERMVVIYQKREKFLFIQEGMRGQGKRWRGCTRRASLREQWDRAWAARVPRNSGHRYTAWARGIPAGEGMRFICNMNLFLAFLYR